MHAIYVLGDRMGADDDPHGVPMLFVCKMYRAGAAPVVPFDLVTGLVAAFGTGPRTRARPPAAPQARSTPGIHQAVITKLVHVCCHSHAACIALD